MAAFDTFARDIQLATAGMEPAAISAELAKLARAELAGAIARGEAAPVYDRYVNGRRDAVEETVQAPGPILYVFSWWRPVIGAALDYMRQHAPRRTGRYADSFIVMVNGRPIAPETDIASDAVVVISNMEPYSRKLHVAGVSKRKASRGQKVRAPNPIFEATRQHLLRQFGQALLDAQIRFLLLPGGYILKGHQRVIAAKKNRKSSAFRDGRATLARRKDTEAGQAMTYPSLVLKMRA